MTKDRGGAALRQVRTLFSVGTVAALTDAQLLERFATRGGEAAEMAFTALVERHGPMVLRVCRRVLADPHDAHDAFQATFLVLVRRAGSIRSRDSVASWLHGVAYRTASCARSAAARRRRHERRAAELARPSLSEDCREDPGPVLHDELERLPAHYREVIVLCDLEDHTHEQAAWRLTLPVGTVKSRLPRGRAQLRIRLLRRGLTPVVGALGATSAVDATAAVVVVPLVLMDSTVRAAVRLAAGRATAEVISAAVASLTKESGRAIVMARSKMAATTILVFGSLATAVGVLAQQEARTMPPPPSPGKVAGPATAPRHPKSDYMVEPPDLLMVQTREGLPGRPISGDRLVRPDGMVSLGYYGEVYVAGLTLAEVKAKIISQLHKRLSDEQLGLVRRDADGTLHRIPPAESDRVSVVVSTSNSKGYFVYRAGASPRRFPLVEDVTVLDALSRVGFTANSSPSPSVRLIRMPSSGLGRPYSLPVNFEAIVRGGDPTTNHHLRSGDRIFVDAALAPTAPSGPDGDRAAAGSDWERQLDEIERQLRQVFKTLADLQTATKADSPRP